MTLLLTNTQTPKKACPPGCISEAKVAEMLRRSAETRKSPGKPPPDLMKFTPAPTKSTLAKSTTSSIVELPAGTPASIKKKLTAFAKRQKLAFDLNESSFSFDGEIFVKKQKGAKTYFVRKSPSPGATSLNLDPYSDWVAGSSNSSSPKTPKKTSKSPDSSKASKRSPKKKSACSGLTETDCVSPCSWAKNAKKPYCMMPREKAYGPKLPRKKTSKSPDSSKASKRSPKKKSACSGLTETDCVSPCSWAKNAKKPYCMMPREKAYGPKLPRKKTSKSPDSSKASKRSPKKKSACSGLTETDCVSPCSWAKNAKKPYCMMPREKAYGPKLPRKKTSKPAAGVAVKTSQKTKVKRNVVPNDFMKAKEAALKSGLDHFTYTNKAGQTNTYKRVTMKTGMVAFKLAGAGSPSSSPKSRPKSPPKSAGKKAGSPTWDPTVTMEEL